MSWKALRFQQEFTLWMTESKEGEGLGGGAPEPNEDLEYNAIPTPPQIAMMWEAGRYQ